MDIRTDEIADRTYRVSVFLPQGAGGAGFMFNHFLLDADQPMLFHCGLRKMFPLISAEVARIIPLSRLRWLSFGHFEADECGSMNEWLDAAPRAEIMHGQTGCRVSIADMADRPPRVLDNNEVVDIGSKRIRYIDTPHVPHGWDAGVIFDEATRTLFCGDLFARTGNGPPLTGNDIVDPAIEAEDLFALTSLGPATAPNIRALSTLNPTTLALMHGSSFAGDGAGALRSLAHHFDARLRAALR